ncbi:aminotransferase class I/II-fold pyridoxal phosphate-dependent enzyme [Paenibacillaceae bacterium WGS1546]|uniref:aminotransferase class I/II-fold pyridoxal phosphate-dependent enzyme n=1 Tax=Cohnella sp. WGS1546 TaxID=3366810 RepID=UPI00372D44EC
MMMNKDKAPLYEALIAHDRLRASAFHVPGHKQRAAWADARAAAYYESLLALDVTELSDTDDLHRPEGPLLEAQRLAAACFGAEETRFLVSGSTAGNLAMILAVCLPGELVVVQRNVHKSILNGLALAGARAVLLPPDVEETSGLATVPGAELLLRTLRRYPEAKAVILSAPNYYGMSPSLEPLVAIVHERGLPVLVDEAHGPHFGFHARFPQPALRAGADLVVQSAHKMLSAMTMGAMLHMQGRLVPRAAVRQALTMVQSSSPSYPIMASLDLARRQLHVQGEEAFAAALEAVDRVVDGLGETRFGALGYGEYAGKGIGYDPLKLVLFDPSGKLGGFELRDALAERNCLAEMADAKYVVLAFGTGSAAEDGARLREALQDISRTGEIAAGGRSPSKKTIRPSAGTDAADPRPIRFGRDAYEAEAVPFEQCVGRIAAEWIIPYPPGIPALFPGETITEDIVERLREWRDGEAHIQGASDPELRSVLVRREADG